MVIAGARLLSPSEQPCDYRLRPFALFARPVLARELRRAADFAAALAFGRARDVDVARALPRDVLAFAFGRRAALADFFAEVFAPAFAPRFVPFFAAFLPAFLPAFLAAVFPVDLVAGACALT